MRSRVSINETDLNMMYDDIEIQFLFVRDNMYNIVYLILKLSAAIKNVCVS